MTFDGIRSAWNRFWFTPADPTVLGLIRIYVGLLVLYSHLAYTSDLQEMLGPDAWIDQQAICESRRQATPAGEHDDWSGLQSPLSRAAAVETLRDRSTSVPRQLPAGGNFEWSLWDDVTGPNSMAVVHAIVLLILFFFMIGFCTPVTSVLAWLAVVSYIQRTPATVDGFDTMINLAMIYLVIGQSGAALSVDRAISRYLNRRRALRERRPASQDLGPTPQVASNIAIRLFQVHLCVIYLVAGLSKLRGDAWWNGTAIWLTLASPELSMIRCGPFYDCLRFLCRHRWLWELVMSGGAALTLAVEISFPYLVWNRSLRWIMVSLAALLHAAIALLMGLTMFSLAMLALLLAFVPSGAGSKRERKSSIEIPS
jgi:hypothetical protein